MKDFNLRIEPGKSYALVGASGAGKSTILSLILRLYDPTSGVVRIDGHDLRSVTQRSLREQIGLVTQDTFLFHDTIFKNIQFGRLDATEEEIYAAAQTAFAHDFIMAQPQGLRDDRRRQGLSPLRRAAAAARHRPRPAQERAHPPPRRSHLRARLRVRTNKSSSLWNGLPQGRTVIAIAHRLSTILSADQIVVMDNGRIKEVGTHAELLEKSGYYRRLYDLQFNRNPDEPGAEVELLAESTV